MTVGELTEWKNVKGLAGMEVATRFLEDRSWEGLPRGRHPIQGDDIYALIVEMNSRSMGGAQFEAHRKYIDIHYLVDGAETIGFAPTKNLRIARPYEESDDAELYDQPADFQKLSLLPGRFAVFLPGDGHLPGCHLESELRLKKVVIKMHTELLKNK